MTDASARGFAIEAKVLSRPAAFLGREIRSFKTIDDYVVRGGRGIATSIKSLDLTAKSYQRGSAVASKFRGFASKLQNMTTASGGNFTVSTAANATNRVTDKVLVIALEQGAVSGSQAGAIAKFLREAPVLPDVKIVLQFIA